MSYSVVINLEYDGDPSQVAMAIRDILKSMTGQDVSLRLNRSDTPASMSKIAALQASQYVKRRPQI